MLREKRQESLPSRSCVASVCSAVWLHEMSRLHLPGKRPNKWAEARARATAIRLRFNQPRFQAPSSLPPLRLYFNDTNFLGLMFYFFLQAKSEEITCTKVKCPDLQCKNPIKMRMTDCCMRCPGKEFKTTLRAWVLELFILGRHYSE